MKKVLYITLLAIAMFVFSFSYSFAANEPKAVQDIRNVVGGAENVVEDAGHGVAEGIRTVTSAGENVMENATHMDGNNSAKTTNRNNNYTATRTSAPANNNTLLGMNSTAWTWIIMAVVGIAIIALVWMYARQFNNDSYHDNNY